MSKEICISSTPHETRLAIIENDELAEIYYERENEYTLAGSIYKGSVTRVLPGMQSAFVDLGLERDAFLYVTDFLEEQEDSADFERVGTAAPGRREGGRESRPESSKDGGRESEGAPAARESRGGEARQPREARDAREPREHRPRAAAQPEQVTEEAAVNPPSPSEGREEEFEQGGTRRWRGRRGRRRGVRGQQQGRETEASAPEQTDGESAQPTSIYASAIQAAPVSATAMATARDVEQPPEPRRPVYTPQTPAAAGKQIFLPGESLSKYGHAPAAEPQIEIEALPSNPIEPERPGPVYTPFKPSTLIETPIVWDGGSLLPGETISRYRKDVPMAPAALATAPKAKTVATDAAEPLLDEPAVQLHGTHQPEEAVEPPYEAAVEPPSEAAKEALVEAAQEEKAAIVGHAAEPTVEAEPLAAIPPAEHQETAEQHPFEHHQSEPAAAESEQAAAESEPVAAIQEEAEPENASASYRVDSSAPSKYRLSTPFAQEPIDQEPLVEAHTAQEAAVETSAEPVVESVIQQPPTTPHRADRVHVDRVLGEAAPGGERAPRHPDVAEQAPAEDASHSYAMPAVEAVAVVEGVAHEERQSAEEMEETDEEAGGEAGDRVGTIQGFAPGRGVIEEEVIEEEEYEYTPLSTHHDEHDLDELEEETIGHNMIGTDLGELVRDSHLETRVNVPFALDEATEEADLEEENYEEGGEENGEESGEESGSIGEDLFDEESEQQAPVRAGAPAPAPRNTDDAHRGGRGGRHGRRRSNNSGGGGNDRGRRATSQLSDLPVISDLLKQGQEILVQIAKEPIAKKGARITSHIALPGRFLVFMPTVNHVGVSRKISSDDERQRLKRILISEKGDTTGGFIVRTAADGASEEDLRADIRFLISLWVEIKQRTDTAKAPALIYHDLNLVERILRDQVSDNFSSIWVDSEVEYERIVRFLNRFQPSLVRRVKLYTKETPLFEQFGIQEEIGKALKSKVWLKSGGSIVINQTEALVAIDINTGKYVGKTSRLEDTIVKTNLDAIPEIVRQIRLRDLGGIIIIDFIDMDERKNRTRVMQALEEALKADRAPSKVLQFNDFGLVAITRKRVKQSLERTLSSQCEICQGTGMVKSPTTVCNEIYVELHKMQKSFDGDVLLRVHPDVVKTLKDNSARWLIELEEMIRKNIIVKSDPSLHPEQFDIH